MSWAEAVNGLNESVISTFAQPISVVVGSLETMLDGIYEAPLAAGQDPARMPFKRPDHQVTFRTGEFRATSAKAGHQVLIGSRRFYIADIEDDDGGMTTVTIRPQ